MSAKTAKRVLRIEAQGLLRLARLTGASFGAAVKLVLRSKGRVLVTGVGKSGLVGQKIAATLSSTGTPALFLGASEAMHGDLGKASKGDVVLALSNSGESDELKTLIPHLKRMGCRIILFTGNARSALARLSDVVVYAGVEKEACPLRLAPTASTTAALALGDALAVALMEAQGFTEKDFALFHPAGELGRRLHLKVGDIMRQGSRVPKVAMGASFPAIVREINAKRVGCACVTGKAGRLEGIIVDGDLRRAMLKDPDIRRWNASNLRTPKPSTIPEGATLAQALQTMEQRSIFQLIVVDGKKRPVGLVHLHDLLGRGAVKIV
ncbi:MAG TPA: KpsF/GutQ family sugar-phosphate isomerase [bacterium]|nr:KpsF/GutQ family sugar-phosphate isomerase [bacterium]